MRIIPALVLMALTLPAAADGENVTYDRVALSVSAEEEVPNDTQVVVLRAQAEGRDSADLAREVNRRIRWGVDKAQAQEGIEVQTVDYRTQPVYREQNLTGWRVSHAMRLESTDSAVLATLLEALQERLGLVSMSYEVSPAARRAAEEALIAEALERFRARAALVTSRLERPGYRIVRLDINTASREPQPPVMRTMAMESARSDAAPVVEAGKQRVEVSIQGTIELRVE